ncbi:MAG: leucyl aminopeptidase [Lagierella massiliensis]|nr:leucyl aminopeptidase [Lagierella massiliensis]
MKYNINESIEPKARIYFKKNQKSVSTVDKNTFNEDVFVKLGDFKAYIGQKNNIPEYLIIIDKDDESPRKLITLGFKLTNEIKRFNIFNFEVSFDDGFSKDIILNVFEGIVQSEYKFDNYKTDTDEKDLELSINIKFKEELNLDDFKYVENLIEGVNLTRYLVNTPAIDMYPETLANTAKEKLSEVGVNVKVLNKKEIEDLGMKAFLAVAEGSEKEPKFIIMEYLPVPGQTPIGLVGKGLTYDSGGYALKSAKGMSTMHADMGGSATVIGTMYALAKNKIQRNAIAFVAACENMISGKAYKNGDIIGSMKGTFIEVDNTDAEGRLTLADAIYYAATKTEVEPIVDLATLTGACVVALGEKTTGVITNDNNLYDELEKSSKEVGEYLWLLPSFDVLRDLLKSKRADIINSTGPYGGASTAGLFLEHFVENKKWAHLDIAGPAYTDSAFDYIPYGATGIPVKTLYNFVKNHK